MYTQKLVFLKIVQLFAKSVQAFVVFFDDQSANSSLLVCTYECKFLFLFQFKIENFQYKISSCLVKWHNKKY